MRQLGFYPGRPLEYWQKCSFKCGIKELTCLKVESDIGTIDDQLQLYRAFEDSQGVKFTLLLTGGKSVHAYLRLDKPIPVDQYKKVCSAFHERLHEQAQYVEILFMPDVAVAGPAQAMRLPGAVHARTREVARVIQFGDTCSLDTLELDREYITTVYKANCKKNAIASQCAADIVLGYAGDEALAILGSIARSWDKRLPGEGTYQKVYPLVADMTIAVGAEQASKILFESGHFDRDGNHSLDGLLKWCKSFEQWIINSSAGLAKARLIQKAERNFGWKRPRINANSIVLKPEVLHSTEEELLNAIVDSGGMILSSTGKGKTKAICMHFADVVSHSQATRGANSMVSAAICSPRIAINEQNAKLTNGYNVSQKQSPSREGRLMNMYHFCPQSIGLRTKQYGSSALWGEYVSYGDTNMKQIRTGAGMPAAALFACDEFRQTMQMLLLSHCGERGLFDRPKERAEVLKSMLRSIANAAHFYALDAQLGTVEEWLIQQIRPGRRDAGRKVGNMPYRHGGTYCWTSKQNTWKALLAEELNHSDRKKPIICIVGGKGQQSSHSTKGMSAWSIARYLDNLFPEQVLGDIVLSGKYKILVVDSETKEDPRCRAVLNGDLSGWDLIIGTPALQSGFSFVGQFHEVGFVAGGSTLPPNVVGGQAPRRERTLKTCYAYLPISAVDRSIPLDTSDIQSNIELMTEAHQRFECEPDKEEILIIEATARYVKRHLEELALFVDYSIAYAAADGWEIAEVADLRKHSQDITSPKSEAKELSRWDRLPLMHQKLLSTCYGNYSLANLVLDQKIDVVGGVGLDLVASNIQDLTNVLQLSGLISICDGQARSKHDPKIVQCGLFLQRKESIAVINHSGLLEIRLGQGKGDPCANAVKTIGSVVRGLGGITQRKGGGHKVAWILPAPSGVCT